MLRLDWSISLTRALGVAAFCPGGSMRPPTLAIAPSPPLCQWFRDKSRPVCVSISVLSLQWNDVSGERLYSILPLIFLLVSHWLQNILVPTFPPMGPWMDWSRLPLRSVQIQWVIDIWNVGRKWMKTFSTSVSNSNNYGLASCPWGPVTANGVDLLTEIYIICRCRTPRSALSRDASALGLLPILAPCQPHWQLANTWKPV